MASNAVAGIGTIIRRWNTTTSEWVALAEIISVDNEKTRNMIDVTHLGSTGGYSEKIPGLRDAGTLQAPMNFTRDTYDLMNADFESETAQNYDITLPDVENSSFEFEGYVSSLGLGIPTDDKITANVTITITGQMTVNSGASSGLT